jgi:hypothetical protein
MAQTDKDSTYRDVPLQKQTQKNNPYIPLVTHDFNGKLKKIILGG